MLRISPVPAPANEIALRVEGQVVGTWVDVLREACQEALRRGLPLRLDLAGVLFVDRDGADLLRVLAEQNVALTNCSPFTAQQLRS